MPADLHDILSRVFGHAEFRQSQEIVCSTLVAGRDVLLVMPTGSGKSLCYQLPGLARGGTTLVISPLIALMEDQSAKLSAKQLRVERIHSGLPRESARAALRLYAQGALDFLFVAPERFRVPGFLQALRQRSPSLVAVDEAHCISQWGHDFRPDYRMLAAAIAALRPAPVIAVTATATPAVQRDIARQLALDDPARVVQGFRRHNIAIEVVDAPPSERISLVWSVLRDPEHRPAIIYAPSRRQAEELAALLSEKYRAAAYHAGLTPQVRHSVQARFLGGELEVVIATVAFGMGIDKADIRSVVHIAIPGSVEAYYQEIGRAGRDGKPSRAVLMHSYADRRMHDFFFERDYPEPARLDAIYRLLGAQPLSKTDLRRRSRLTEDDFDCAYEKLWIHGGAFEDSEENVTRGQASWQQTYEEQRARRRAQIDLVIRFAQSPQCRMASLVRYFGDRTDTQSWCGLCDFCAPERAIVQAFRPAKDWEQDAVHTVLDTLRSGHDKPTGKMHSELFPRGIPARDDFEELLCAMARGGLVTIRNEVFEKEGRSVPYRVARITPEGSQTRGDTPDLLFRVRAQAQRSPKRAAASKSAAARRPSGEHVDNPLCKALRGWRLEEAKRRGVPAFRIFTDRMLDELVDARPDSEEELLEIRGFSRRSVEQIGRSVLDVIAQHGA